MWDSWVQSWLESHSLQLGIMQSDSCYASFSQHTTGRPRKEIDLYCLERECGLFVDFYHLFHTGILHRRFWVCVDDDNDFNKFECTVGYSLGSCVIIDRIQVIMIINRRHDPFFGGRRLGRPHNKSKADDQTNPIVSAILVFIIGIFGMLTERCPSIQLNPIGLFRMKIIQWWRENTRESR